MNIHVYIYLLIPVNLFQKTAELFEETIILASFFSCQKKIILSYPCTLCASVSLFQFGAVVCTIWPYRCSSSQPRRGRTVCPIRGSSTTRTRSRYPWTPGSTSKSSPLAQFTVCPRSLILCRKLLYKMGQYFFNIQCIELELYHYFAGSNSENLYFNFWISEFWILCKFQVVINLSYFLLISH